VIAAIGAGGMGEVYRARDTKLNRDVAIKVIPLEVAGNSERLARFNREAQVLASLNHPNIGAIYGLEDSGDVRALVMEQRPYPLTLLGYRGYDVTPDGKRFLVVDAGERAPIKATEMILIQNWTEELKRLVPAK